MRCESTHFGVKFYQAPLCGGRRYTPCTPAQDRAAVAKNMGSNPHFGAIWGVFGGKGACFHALNTRRCSRLHLRCSVFPSHHTHRREKKHQTGNSWILARRLFSHETGSRPLKPRKISAAQAETQHPPPALRRTLTVTIIPVTSASGAAAPGVGDRAQGGACGSW